MTTPSFTSDRPCPAATGEFPGSPCPNSPDTAHHCKHPRPCWDRDGAAHECTCGHRWICTMVGRAPELRLAKPKRGR